LKKLIKLCLAVLAVVTLVSFAGCSARTPISADEFTKQAKAQGFTVKEATSSNADVDKYLTATKEETGTELVFISFKTDAAAEELYTSLKKSISEGTTSSGKALDSATYNKYTLANGELNHTLARMNATIVYGKTTTAYQNQVNDFFKVIKY